MTIDFTLPLYLYRLIYCTIGLFITVNSFSQNTIHIDASNSPFYILSDTTIIDGDSLLISAGAQVFINNSVNLNVYGYLSIVGSEQQPAEILPINKNVGWGEIIIHESVDSLQIINARIIDGRVLTKACNVHYKNTTFINQQNLIWNQAISRFFGGELLIEDCVFKGTNQGEGLLCHDIINPIVFGCIFDSIPDAVEFLNCNAGRIGKCTFQNSKDDAIDLNHCTQTLIDSNLFFNIYNRGMEIGSENNGSSTDIFVHHNILVNCEEAITFKEGSTGKLANNSFYKNQIAVSAMVLGNPSLGSSIEIINCIFQSNDQDLFTDSKSEIRTSYSSSNIQLITGENNLLGPAKFISPSDKNFNLNLASDCINSGSPESPFDPDGSRADMGALFQPLQGLLPPIRLWPNPAREQINFQLINTFKELQIYDYTGRNCVTLEISETKYIQLSTYTLAPGIYFALFSSPDKSQLLRFVVL